MKPKLKKYLIIGSSILIPVSLISLGTGLYFNSSNLERISQKGIYNIKINEPLNNEGYKFDLSYSYGSVSNTSKNSLLLINELLHLKSEGDFKYDQINDVVIQPSYESYKFSLIDSIVLTFVKAGTSMQELKNADPNNSDLFFQLVFDSDDDSITPQFNPSNNNDFVLTKTSNDPRSINNPNVFGKILSSGYLSQKINLDDQNLNIDTTQHNFMMVNLGVTFNDNAYWVDSNGNKTKYNICPEDMFYSIKRTLLFDRKYRQSHGGSKELDSYFIEKTQTTKLFGENQKFPNEYLFEFFGIKKDYLYDETKAIQSLLGNPNKKSYVFTFNIFNNNQVTDSTFVYSNYEIINKYLINSLTFSLSPSQYIKEKFADNQNVNQTKVGTIEGEARKYGIYTYGQNREDVLYASYYIPVSSSGGREVYQYNKYHPDLEWVNNVENGFEKDGKTYKNLNTVILEYAGGIDSSTFNNQTFNAFLSGTVSEMDYSLISDAQKQQLYGNDFNNKEVLIANSEANGLRATKNINISKLNTRTVWQAFPTDNLQYTFNDVYAKLVYGSSIDELNNGSAIISNTFFGGVGLEFRNLIQASINWNQYIQTAYSGVRDASLSGAAQDAKFSSTNPNSLKPADFNELGINDLFYLDENGKQQTVTLKEMKTLSGMTGEELDDKYGPGTSNNMRLALSKSPQYSQIQKAMKALLDKFYQKNNLSNNDLIEWEIPYSFADQDETKCKATEYIVENVINGLDPRIKATFFKPTSRNDMLNSISQRRGAYNANLWSYDYEGIGSYIAAFFSEGSGTNLMGAIGIFAKDPASTNDNLFLNNRLSRNEIKSLQTQYPLFTELAKFIATNINKEFGSNASEDVKVENWDLITNKDMNHIVSFFNDATKNPNNVKPIDLIPVLLKEFETESSWEKDASLSEEGKGNMWTKLIKEMNSIKGVSIDTETSIDKLTNVNYVLYLKEYQIPISKYGINLFSNYQYEVKK